MGARRFSDLLDPSLNYLQINGKPCFIDDSDSIIDIESLKKTNGSSYLNRKSNFVRRIFTAVSSYPYKKTNKNLDQLAKELPESALILVIGGGTIGDGMKKFVRDVKGKLISMDVYDSPNVDIIADGHKLPFKNHCFDLVIIQAVLEHVLEPHVVVGEIHRVLKKDGFVYAETPFIQTVHEGAYDFTRFTHSGHRYLFKNFTELNSGSVLGIGFSMVWVIQNYFESLFRSSKLSKLFTLPFYLLYYLDAVIPEKYHIDFGSGFYFVGKKSEAPIVKKSIIHYYRGRM